MAAGLVGKVGSHAPTDFGRLFDHRPHRSQVSGNFRQYASCSRVMVSGIARTSSARFLDYSALYLNIQNSYGAQRRPVRYVASYVAQAPVGCSVAQRRTFIV
jgi:hypothetical protein